MLMKLKQKKKKNYLRACVGVPCDQKAIFRTRLVKKLTLLSLLVKKLTLISLLVKKLTLVSLLVLACVLRSPY